MAFKHVLKSILEPTIPLKEMSLMNTTNEGDVPPAKKVWRTNRQDRGSKDKAGAETPLIMVNSYIMNKKGIEDVIIDESGFLPNITVVYTDIDDNFSPVQFPGANPILSIYIKPPNDKLKPIRNDYIIRSVRGSETIVIKGELFIPKIYDNISRSYRDINSKNSILEVAKEMGLGFQSNDCDPSDKMTWINPNWNSKTFIKHVASHSYQDEDSFFQVFIDKYYHINFINVNLQIEADGEFDNTIFSGNIDYNLSENVQIEETKTATSVPMGLYQTPRSTTGNNIIRKKHLITNQGEILINNGFKKRIYYYDMSLNEDDPINKLQDFYVKPTESTVRIARENGLIPSNTQLKDNEIKKWINIQYGNVHAQYNAAKVLNHHNLLELDKIKLFAQTDGINFNASRGMRVPVAIYDAAQDSLYSKSYEKADIKSRSISNIKSKQEPVFNEFYSGIYYTMGSKYIYEKGQEYRTEIILGRRDWIPNPET